jgi:hypothetical protein
MTEIGDNSKPARAEIIRSIKAELDEIEIAKAALSLRAKKAKGRIKAELGEKVADFNVLIRFVDLEEDPRSELNRLLREGFAALGVGQQMNFMDAIDPQPVANEAIPEKPAKVKKTKKAKTIAEEIAEAVIEHGLEDEVITQTDIEEFVESEAALA